MEVKRVLVDFDGVIMSRGKDRSWQVMIGASEAMEHLKSLGYDVVVFTTRVSSESYTPNGVIEKWLEKNKIPFNYVTAEKLEAEFYIDDKAIEFTDWNKTIKRIGHENL